MPSAFCNLYLYLGLGEQFAGLPDCIVERGQMQGHVLTPGVDCIMGVPAVEQLQQGQGRRQQVVALPALATFSCTLLCCLCWVPRSPPPPPSTHIHIGQTGGSGRI
jgi:hypothetical protein